MRGLSFTSLTAETFTTAVNALLGAIADVARERDWYCHRYQSAVTGLSASIIREPGSVAGFTCNPANLYPAIPEEWLNATGLEARNTAISVVLDAEIELIRARIAWLINHDKLARPAAARILEAAGWPLFTEPQRATHVIYLPELYVTSAAEDGTPEDVASLTARVNEALPTALATFAATLNLATLTPSTDASAVRNNASPDYPGEKPLLDYPY